MSTKITITDLHNSFVKILSHAVQVQQARLAQSTDLWQYFFYYQSRCIH